LEDHLGLKLFKRSVRAVNLTPTGATYARSVRDALDRLAAATAEIMDQHSTGVLNISTLDSFAAKWLIPRLFRFRQAMATLKSSYQLPWKLADFVNDGIDIAIRYGSGRYPRSQGRVADARRSFSGVQPVARERRPTLKSAAELKHHTLIHDSFEID
jgi:LysR family glycine cleavage system transcriptional activator